MKKIEELEKMVNDQGTPRMKEIIMITKKYFEGLDNIFKSRDVHKFILETIDFPMFIQELNDEGYLDNKSGIEQKILFINVTQVARHTWELIDDHGRKKNGDDLHRAWPIIFPNDEMRDINTVFEDLKHY